MQNKNTDDKYGKIDPKKKASPRQFFGAVGHLSKLSPNKKLYHYGNIKGALADIYKGNLTHGDVQSIFSSTTFPKAIKDSIDNFDPSKTEESLPLS